MAKKAAKKKAKASDRKKSAPKKQAVKKKTTKRTAKKKAPKKKAVKKSSLEAEVEKQTSVPLTAPKAVPAPRKAPKKAPQSLESQSQGPLAGVSTVFASSKTNAWQPYPLLRIIELDEARREMAARKDELDEQHKKAEVAFDLLSKELELQRIRRENQADSQYGEPAEDYGDVTGMKVCFRTKYSQLVSPMQYVIMVNVASKISQEGLEKRKISPLPVAINDTPIKVVEGSFGLAATDSTELGRLASGQGAPDPPDSGIPVIGGQPIAEAGEASKYGTLGIVVGDGDEIYGLTNEHVASDQAIRITTSGSQFIGTGFGSTSNPKANPFVDASKILIDQVNAIPYMIKGVNDRSGGFPVYFASQPLPERTILNPVYKFGASTNRLLQGFLDSNVTEVTIPSISSRPLKNIISAKHESDFLLGGDSGSLLMLQLTIRSKPSWLVIGLVFAQLVKVISPERTIPDNKVAFACCIHEVISRLNLSSKIDKNRFADNEEWKNQIV